MPVTSYQPGTSCLSHGPKVIRELKSGHFFLVHIIKSYHLQYICTTLSLTKGSNRVIDKGSKRGMCGIDFLKQWKQPGFSGVFFTSVAALTGLYNSCCLLQLVIQYTQSQHGPGTSWMLSGLSHRRWSKKNQGTMWGCPTQ